MWATPDEESPPEAKEPPLSYLALPAGEVLSILNGRYVLIEQSRYSLSRFFGTSAQMIFGATENYLLSKQSSDLGAALPAECWVVSANRARLQLAPKSFPLCPHFWRSEITPSLAAAAAPPSLISLRLFLFPQLKSF